jgi:hypothetical protein
MNEYSEAKQYEDTFKERDDSPFCEFHHSVRKTLCQNGTYLCSACWYEDKILGEPLKIPTQNKLNSPRIVYSTEKEYVDQLEAFLKECGCKTWREESPLEHKDIELPFRIDLIFFREDFGYIGIEAKNFRSLRQGGLFGQAIEQINKYRELTYLDGIKIKKWCIAAPISIPSMNQEISKAVVHELLTFLRHFLDYSFNISILEFKEYSNPEWSRVVIDGFIGKGKTIYIKRGDKDGESI